MTLKIINKTLILLLLCTTIGQYALAQLNPNVLPAENFDLSEWKLNYPMYNTEKEDLSTFSNDYFFTDTITGGMVFICPNIVLETGGSSYPRCELRELLNKGASASAKSNNWTLSTNTSRDDYGGYNGQLYATLSVDRVSSTYDSKSKVGRVIVGQIHGDDNEPCRIYYRLLPGHTKGSIYFAHEQSKAQDDKQEYWHVLIGSKDSDASEPEDGIALGEIWSYKIDVQDEQMTVSIYNEDGDLLADKTISSTMSGSDNFDAGYASSDNYLYFKAGVYNQNNGGDADDYAQATFYTLLNNHDPDSDSIPGSSDLRVTPSNIQMPGSGGVQTISLNSSEAWSASIDVDWLTLSLTSGTGDAEIAVTIETNQSGADRQGIITVTSKEGVSRYTTVQQARIIPEGSAQALLIDTAVASIENTSKGEVASNVIDNNFSTLWAGDGTDTDPTLDLYLRKQYIVSGLEIACSKQNQRETYFSVQYWDGSAYVDLLQNQTQAIVNDDQATSLFPYDFPSAVTTDQVRIIGHGNSSSEWNSYLEVRLMGWDVEGPLGNTDQNTPSILLYPNPSSGTISIVSAENTDLKIYSMSGALVFSTSIQSITEVINTELKQGIYWVQLYRDQEIVGSQKIIIE